MTADALAVVQALFTTIWSLTSSWYIPGTNVTPLEMAFFILASSIIFRIVKKYLFGDDDSG